jgi:RNA polymerase sigma-70 factor (ECF subfamily)
LDKATLLKAKNGDKDTMALIFDTYNQRIFRYVYIRIHDRAVAEDLASMVFIKLLENISKLDLTKNFEAWLFTITRNTLIDLHRKSKFISSSELVDMAKDEVDHSEKAEVIVLTEEVKKCFPQLKTEERDVIELTYFAELSDAEICKIISKPVGNIRVIRFRALQKLKSLINTNRYAQV